MQRTFRLALLAFFFARSLTASSPTALAGGYSVPQESLSPDLQDPSTVQPYNGEEGGGMEYRNPRPIDVPSDIPWVPIGP